jgi:hypothetical protein
MNGPEIKSEKRQESHGAHVGVIVLGDTGRSPRMQYHAISLISMCPEIQKVSILGYNGEKCNDLIRNNPNIHDIRSFYLQINSSLISSRVRLSTTNRLIDWLRFIPLVHASKLLSLFSVSLLHSFLLLQSSKESFFSVHFSILSSFLSHILILFLFKILQAFLLRWLPSSFPSSPAL